MVHLPGFLLVTFPEDVTDAIPVSELLHLDTVFPLTFREKLLPSSTDFDDASFFIISILSGNYNSTFSAAAHPKSPNIIPIGFTMELAMHSEVLNRFNPKSEVQSAFCLCTSLFESIFTTAAYVGSSSPVFHWNNHTVSIPAPLLHSANPNPVPLQNDPPVPPGIFHSFPGHSSTAHTVFCVSALRFPPER